MKESDHNFKNGFLIARLLIHPFICYRLNGIFKDTLLNLLFKI